MNMTVATAMAQEAWWKTEDVGGMKGAREAGQGMWSKAR